MLFNAFIFFTKQGPYICCLQGTQFRLKDPHRLKVKGWKNIFHENWSKQKPLVAILIPDKIDFKTKTIITDKPGYYIMIKWSIHQEYIEVGEGGGTGWGGVEGRGENADNCNWIKIN